MTVSRAYTTPIKATAGIISRTTAKANAMYQSGIGSASPVDRSNGTAWIDTPLLIAAAFRVNESGIRHFIYVTPTEPQQLVWLVPQVGIDYQIETSTNLHWQIK